MKVLITGTAGFIGFHLVNTLVKDKNIDIVGVDNINDYYDIELKFARLNECGIQKKDVRWHVEVQSEKHTNYRFIRMNLENKGELMSLCSREKFNVVIHLAAQAGVRYSILNPDAYAQSNLTSFLNILEICRFNAVENLVYASSSSVYGLNSHMPFSAHDNVDHPVSLYAASKKANELMAHAYSHLYNIPTTGLRFFTVYGPWGRPDMAYFLFADAISKGKSIQLFNHGKMKRDFTYIDDIVQGIISVMNKPAKRNPNWDSLNPDPASSSAPYAILNIGNNTSVDLLHFVKTIEKNLGKEAIIDYKEMQDGDVVETWADIDELTNEYGYVPVTSIEKGLGEFSVWFKDYYNVN
jgi:UDP-glucuronate 4-epimerase